MAITAALVKELRDKTGAGMMDSKKALTENNGPSPPPAKRSRITSRTRSRPWART